MPQKVNLRESPVLYKVLKAYHIVAMFMHGAVLLRLFILLPLVGRKFLSGGIGDFFNKVTLSLSIIEFVLSVVKLLPLQPSLVFLQNWVKIFIVATIFSHDNVLLNHSCYSLLIFTWSSYGFIGYLYWFWKLKNIGKVPRGLLSLFQNTQLVLFPIIGSVEFIILFLSLRYIDGDYAKELKFFTQIVLLFYIPTKFYLYKRLVFKVFQIDSRKMD